MFKKLNALLLAVAAAIATVSAQTQEQMFLNDDDFYLPQYECDVTLPNGIHLLYLEEDEDLIPRSKPYDHSLDGTLWALHAKLPKATTSPSTAWLAPIMNTACSSVTTNLSAVWPFLKS